MFNRSTVQRIGRAIGVVGLLVVGSGGPVWAEHFGIDLTVKTPRGQVESHWDTSPPEGGVNPRPMVTAKVGDRVDVEWLMRSVFPHVVMKKVEVHLFVVKVPTVGQKSVPSLKSGVWTESHLTMDFLPDHAARGSLRLTARAPGVYLVRIESENTDSEVAHEHFSAIDLKVE